MEDRKNENHKGIHQRKNLAICSLTFLLTFPVLPFNWVSRILLLGAFSSSYEKNFYFINCLFFLLAETKFHIIGHYFLIICGVIEFLLIRKADCKGKWPYKIVEFFNFFKPLYLRLADLLDFLQVITAYILAFFKTKYLFIFILKALLLIGRYNYSQNTRNFLKLVIKVFREIIKK